ncbi:MAG: MBL fold metallo-hydrolase [Verrucomicrobiales bacterium]|nr:MBL fold metallo-hydrolase [Verrucomicrobiales bacterium]
MQFTILGSGSGGNCAYLETPGARLLIDAGFSGKQIRERLAGIGRSPETLTGILVTHEHIDHIQGLGVLAKKLDVPVYCNRFTREAAESILECRLKASVFQTGAAFEIGDVTVETFSVPHDAQDPVGFLFRTSAGNVGFLTDLGHATKRVLERVRPANVLVLEANHDLKLLQEDTKRPWSTKQRILSRHGHLSNDAAAEVAAEVANSTLSRIYLGHLSRDCNRPELARDTVVRKLGALGIGHIAVENTSQERPCGTMVLAASVPALPARNDGQLAVETRASDSLPSSP